MVCLNFNNHSSLKSKQIYCNNSKFVNLTKSLDNVFNKTFKQYRDSLEIWHWAVHIFFSFKFLDLVAEECHII
jgi:hypothetical protein